jgi:hypothetical protein
LVKKGKQAKRNETFLISAPGTIKKEAFMFLLSNSLAKLHIIYYFGCGAECKNPNIPARNLALAAHI